MSKLQNNAHKWMLEGIKQHELFQKAFQSAKEYALNAGFFFLSAKSGFEHGEWENFCAGYTSKIPHRSIQRYMEFASEVSEWVKSESPKLVGMEKISAAAREMVLQSPKGLVALCRELKLMRKFGEYDEVKYRAKKMLGDNKQLELEFDALFMPVVQLSKIGQPNFHIKLPEGKNELEAYEELAANLDAARDCVRAQINKLKTIEA